MSYKIEWHDSLNICKFSGDTNGTEIEECNDIVHGDAKFDDLRCSIWDFGDVEDFDFTVEQCIRIAALDTAAAKTNPRINVAIIATKDIVETIINLYEAEMLSSPWETRVFKNMDEALSWCS